MSAISISSIRPMVYVILGIDSNEHDQVLGVCSCYEDAKQHCIDYLRDTEFYDIWVEKHSVM